MRRRMKYSLMGAAFIITAGMLMGCGVTYPEITQEEEEHVIEYATGLLLKYDKKHEHSLVELEEAEEATPTPTPEPAAVAEIPEENTILPEEVPDQPEAVDMSNPNSLSDIMGIPGFDFQYTGCTTADVYPNNAMPDFVVSATEQNKLLVLTFNVTNNSGADYYLDMSQRNVRFKIGWNGGEAKNALTTMLLNDMASYKDQIPAGQTVQMVVIGEMPAANANSIYHVQFLVVDGEETNPTNL